MGLPHMKYIMNYTQSSSETQTFFQEIPTTKAELKLFLERCHSSQSKLLNTLVYYTNRYNNVYCSMVHLAIRCGVTVQTIRKWLAQFEALGILRRCYRPGTTNVYRLHGIIFSQTMRTALAHLIPSLLVTTFLPIALLRSNYQLELSSGSIKRSIFIKSMHAIATVERETYSKRESGARAYEEAFSKKEILMNQFKREKWNINISKLIGLNLTQYGAVELSQFPDDILAQVGHFIASSRQDFNNPYAFAMKQCMQQCKQENIIPDKMGVQHKWDLLQWPDRYLVEKYDTNNPYHQEIARPKKPINGRVEAASTHREFKGHTLPQGYKFKTWDQETSAEMEQNIEKFLQTDEWAVRAKKMGPQMTATMLELMRSSIANKKEQEREARQAHEERTVSEAHQMKIE